MVQIDSRSCQTTSSTVQWLARSEERGLADVTHLPGDLVLAGDGCGDGGRGGGDGSGGGGGHGWATWSGFG